MPRSVVVWFRDDLRLADNPALVAALERGPVVPVFVLDEDSPGVRPAGGASRWWLHQSLSSLAADLAGRGSSLTLFRGCAEEVISRVARDVDAGAVVWNRRYGLAEREADGRLKQALRGSGIAVESFNAALLYEPWTVQTKAGTPMKVFTPFWRAARETGAPSLPLPAPSAIASGPNGPSGALSLDELALRPTRPDWAGGLRAAWTPGEAGAAARLGDFLAEGLRGYGENRDRPDLASTSGLSPHLRFGEIGPRQIWHATRHAHDSGTTPASDRDVEKFLAEIGWREFSYHLLFHNPDLASRNFQPRFDDFPWRADEDALRLWQRGRTGYPIVDAGMRQLWQTGWMHNRVRMIAASFLIKDLLIHWRRGEEWFWDTLVDADPASNAASWQWVAGSGADAAPYFRIFNPITQGEKFDPSGDYVRRFVPELAGLPADVIHRPWEASPARLQAAGIRLGHTYPSPVVDHSKARDRSLAAFESLKPNVNDARIGH